MYFKVVKNNNIIDVLSQLIHVRFQERNSIVIKTNTKETAMGVLSSDRTRIYHTNYMAEFPKDKYGNYLVEFENVEISEISEETYNELHEALSALYGNDDEPISEPSIPDEPIEETIIIDDNSLELVKAAKIKKMSADCNAVIVSGTDIVLTDGQLHHFDMTVEDQLNIITLKGMVDQGIQQIPYHATDEVCKFYSADDILLLMDGCSKWKIYHVSYFNSLKIYIESLETMEEVKNIYYGIEIPEEYQSDVLKQLLTNQ